MLGTLTLRLAAWGRKFLVVALLLTCGALFLHSVYRVAATLKEGTPASAVASAAQPSHEAVLQRVLHANLLGGNAGGGAASGSSLQVHGTFAGGEGTASYAIISRSGGLEKSYRVGDRLGDGAQITGIFSDRVVVSKDGGEQVLWLKEKQ